LVVFSKHGADTEARIEISSIDGTPRGTRSLMTSGHCSALDDSLALSVALLVDQPPDPEPEAQPEATAPSPPALTAAAPPAAPPAPASPPAPPRAVPTPITIPPEVAAPREPWRFSLGASGLASWGVLPGVVPALALYSKVLPPHFVPILLQGEGLWPATAERDASSGARFRLFRAGLALCPALHEAPQVSAAVCFGQKIGWLKVDGYGFDQDLSQRRLSFALTAGGEGRLRLFAPVSLRGYLGAEVPLARDRFTSGGRNPSELFELSPIAILGEIGLEAALW
jgi:hypothetical protein